MGNVKYRVKKGDLVQVMAGKDSGKTGAILKIDRERGRVLVEGLNMVKKTLRPKAQGEKGSIIEKEALLDLSNVQILCKKCGPTRIGFRTEGGVKERFCKKCGGTL